MDKNFYLELVRSGRRMPIATHLVLHEKSDPEAILIDGERLAAVMLAGCSGSGTSTSQGTFIRSIGEQCLSYYDACVLPYITSRSQRSGNTR